ncbi:peptidase associated/transthyretin-like domain-containing protein [Labilibacter marinus]|uniref:hypothetical protein n=1 Tax=Labilibacter marinus TaxID=1477105 RepID=UPI00082A5275|nr:hypothetical protein [Labilibacter marinus]
MKLKHILPVLLLAICSVASAQMQKDSLLFRGVIMEGDSLFSLPYAKYSINDKLNFTTSEEGQFSFWAQNGDVVHFSYVGFKPLYVQVNDSLANANFLMGVFLSRDTIELSEVVIIPQIMNPNAIARNMPMLSSQDDIVAQNNVATSTYQAKTQPIKEWDAEMNQKNFLEARSMDVQYKTMIQPSQVLGVSNVAISQQIDRSKINNLKKPRRQYISQSEWEYLIASYEEKMKKKFGDY